MIMIKYGSKRNFLLYTGKHIQRDARVYRVNDELPLSSSYIINADKPFTIDNYIHLQSLIGIRKRSGSFFFSPMVYIILKYFMQ